MANRCSRGPRALPADDDMGPLASFPSDGAISGADIVDVPVLLYFVMRCVLGGADWAKIRGPRF